MVEGWGRRGRGGEGEGEGRIMCKSRPVKVEIIKLLKFVQGIRG